MSEFLVLCHCSKDYWSATLFLSPVLRRNLIHLSLCTSVYPSKKLRPAWVGHILASFDVTPCRNETQILRFRAVGYYDSPMGIYNGARYQVSSNVHSSLNKHLSEKICSRCSWRRYKEPFRATHVCSCVVVIANTSRDRRIRAEIWRSKI